MKCPTCPDSTLVMTDRQGVEIDYCPLCRGVWLDRGELDKLIDRAGTIPTRAQHGSSNHGSFRGPKHGRRESWLSEIFD